MKAEQIATLQAIEFIKSQTKKLRIMWKEITSLKELKNTAHSSLGTSTRRPGGP